MSILTILLTLAIVGFVAYLIVTYIPMPAPFKQVILVVLVILLIVWLCNGLGLLGSINTPLHLH